MKKFKIHPICAYIFSLAIGFFILSACEPLPKSKFDCIATSGEITFSYPVDQWTASNPPPALVPAESTGWKFQYTDRLFGNPSQIIARGDEQIWILDENLLMFNKNNNKVTPYTISQGTSEMTPQKLLLTKKNALWVGGELPGGETILSKYDDNTGKFDEVFDLSSSGGILDLQEGANGTLWLLVYGEGIVSFDPFSALAKEVLSQRSFDEKIISSFVVDANNNLWLATYQKNWQDSILFFDTQSLKLSSLPLGINQISPNTGLLVDNKNRLWISDYAFWKIGTPLPTEDYSGLNMIVRSPVFITQQKPYSDYAWLRPKLLLQDSQENIWYTSFGLVKLDPSTGTWCKVLDSNNFSTSLTEDTDGRFWIVLDGKLYVHD